MLKGPHLIFFLRIVWYYLIRSQSKSVATETEISTTSDTFILLEECFDAGLAVVTNPTGTAKI
jgi:hypothetical protein